MALNTAFNEVMPKIRKLDLQEPVKLIEPELELLEALSEHVPESELVHDLEWK